MATGGGGSVPEGGDVVSSIRRSTASGESGSGWSAASSDWGSDAQGCPSDDPREVIERGFLTPLGGSAEGSSYKGYGLVTMVDILAGGLSRTLNGAGRAGREPQSRRNSGHFVLALDPGLFGDGAAFVAAVDAYCHRLPATPPAGPAQPVLVAGDPGRAAAPRRVGNLRPAGPARAAAPGRRGRRRALAARLRRLRQAEPCSAALRAAA